MDGMGDVRRHRSKKVHGCCCQVILSLVLLFFFVVFSSSSCFVHGVKSDHSSATILGEIIEKSQPGSDIGYFLAISDIHYNPNSTDYYPHYGQDSPFWLVNSSIAAMASLLPNPDLIILTGDLTVHSYTNPPALEQEWVCNTIAGLFEEYFGSSSSPMSSSNIFIRSPILAIGNNDLVPRYPAPPAKGDPIDWFQNLTRYWPSLNSTSEAYESFIYGGYYRVDPFLRDEKLTILVLHTNYWSSQDQYTLSDPDPVGQFAWLGKELSEAQAEGRSIWIMGHIPPGFDVFAGAALWQEYFVDRYIETTSPYLGRTIKMSVFAHEHKVWFRMQSGRDSVPFPIQQHSSVSPVYNNNPTFRVYTYNRTDFEILDYQDWFMNIASLQNSTTENSTVPVVEWRPLFSSAVEEYNLQPIFGLFSDGGVWWDFLERMATDEPLYARYVNNSYSGVFAANSANYTANLCDFAFLYESDFETCLAAGGPFYS